MVLNGYPKQSTLAFAGGGTDILEIKYFNIVVLISFHDFVYSITVFFLFFYRLV